MPITLYDLPPELYITICDLAKEMYYAETPFTFDLSLNDILDGTQDAERWLYISKKHLRILGDLKIHCEGHFTLHLQHTEKAGKGGLGVTSLESLKAPFVDGKVRRSIDDALTYLLFDDEYDVLPYLAYRLITGLAQFLAIATEENRWDCVRIVELCASLAAPSD